MDVENNQIPNVPGYPNSEDIHTYVHKIIRVPAEAQIELA